MNSMNSMQKLMLALGIVVACALPLVPAQAGGLKPGWNAYGRLQYGSGWEAYDAGCLTWNYRQQAWYTHCGLPQNGPLHQPRVIITK